VNGNVRETFPSSNSPHAWKEQRSECLAPEQRSNIKRTQGSYENGTVSNLVQNINATCLCVRNGTQEHQFVLRFIESPVSSQRKVYSERKEGGGFYGSWRGKGKLLLVLLPQERKRTEHCIMGKAPTVRLSSLCTGLHNTYTKMRHLKQVLRHAGASFIPNANLNHV
jgi:hypothetical protein